MATPNQPPIFPAKKPPTPAKTSPAPDPEESEADEEESGSYAEESDDGEEEDDGSGSDDEQVDDSEGPAASSSPRATPTAAPLGTHSSVPPSLDQQVQASADPLPPPLGPSSPSFLAGADHLCPRGLTPPSSSAFAPSTLAAADSFPPLQPSPHAAYAPAGPATATIALSGPETSLACAQSLGARSAPSAPSAVVGAEAAKATAAVHVPEAGPVDMVQFRKYQSELHLIRAQLKSLKGKELANYQRGRFVDGRNFQSSHNTMVKSSARQVFDKTPKPTSFGRMPFSAAYGPSHTKGQPPPSLSKPWVAAVCSNLDEKRINLAFRPPSIENGEIVVEASDESLNLARSRWSDYLVGYFLEGRLPFPSVEVIANRMWAKHGLVETLSYNKEFFLFKFPEASSREKLLDHGPFLFSGRPLILQQWTPSLVLSKVCLSKIPLWVKIYNIPLAMWNPTGLGDIASAIGVPLFADSTTEKLQRFDFARICIQVDASKPLLDEFKLRVQGEIVKLQVEYQWRPKRCSKCCTFGHSCPRVLSPSGARSASFGVGSKAASVSVLGPVSASDRVFDPAPAPALNSVPAPAHVPVSVPAPGSASVQALVQAPVSASVQALNHASAPIPVSAPAVNLGPEPGPVPAQKLVPASVLSPVPATNHASAPVSGPGPAPASMLNHAPVPAPALTSIPASTTPANHAPATLPAHAAVANQVPILNLVPAPAAALGPDLLLGPDQTSVPALSPGSSLVSGPVAASRSASAPAAVSRTASAPAARLRSVSTAPLTAGPAPLAGMNSSSSRPTEIDRYMEGLDVDDDDYDSMEDYDMGLGLASVYTTYSPKTRGQKAKKALPLILPPPGQPGSGRKGKKKGKRAKR